MTHLSPPSEISFAALFFCSAFAACFAELCTIPLDTAKVRLQLQKRAALGEEGGTSKYKGLLGTIVTIAKEEGLIALWKGIIPGLHRQFIYGGLRISLYGPVKAFCSGGNILEEVSLFQKIVAALITGAIAITLANPTDLVKVRLQAEGKLPPGAPRRYSGALNAYFTIVKEEGLVALWTGLGPNIARNAIVNAAELASYDQVKQSILRIPGFTDNIFTHLLAGLGAGFFAVLIGSPVDVVKSRMMGDSIYKSTLDCMVKTLRVEGALAFYKGFLPNFGRLGSWNVIMFLTLEQVPRIPFCHGVIGPPLDKICLLGDQWRVGSLLLQNSCAEIQVGNHTCARCGYGIETVDHLLITCTAAKLFGGHWVDGWNFHVLL